MNINITPLVSNNIGDSYFFEINNIGDFQDNNNIPREETCKSKNINIMLYSLHLNLCVYIPI